MDLEAGDLITLYRRSQPGLGVIIEKVDDVISISKNGEENLKKLITEWNDGKDFRTRNRAISNFIEDTGLDDALVISFLQSNKFYRYSLGKPVKNIKNIKKTFVKIFWISKPSDYNVKIVRRNIDWFPIDWLRAPKKSKKIT
tara:strand:- start:176 stop:601 length:426 start_codon:yes stop_codon:yes gene_type:complete